MNCWHATKIHSLEIKEIEVTSKPQKDKRLSKWYQRDRHIFLPFSFSPNMKEFTSDFALHHHNLRKREKAEFLCSIHGCLDNSSHSLPRAEIYCIQKHKPRNLLLCHRKWYECCTASFQCTHSQSLCMLLYHSSWVCTRLIFTSIFITGKWAPAQAMYYSGKWVHIILILIFQLS